MAGLKYGVMGERAVWGKKKKSPLEVDAPEGIMVVCKRRFLTFSRSLVSLFKESSQPFQGIQSAFSRNPVSLFKESS